MPEITYNDRGIPILTVTPKGVSDIIPSIVSEAEAAEIPTKPLVDFDVDAAIRDGASTQEIAQFVSKKANFDYNAAIKDGVTDGEIISSMYVQSLDWVPSPYISSSDPDAAQLNSLIQGTLAPTVRSLGEKGNLSDTDIKRAISLMPSLTDSGEVAWRKYNGLRELFNEIKMKSIEGGAGKTPQLNTQQRKESTNLEKYLRR